MSLKYNWNGFELQEVDDMDVHLCERDQRQRFRNNHAIRGVVVVWCVKEKAEGSVASENREQNP